MLIGGSRIESGSAAAEGTSPLPEAPRRTGRGRLQRVLYFSVIVAFVVLAIWLATIELEGALAEVAIRYGYIGYLIAASIAGINVIVPTTHLIFTAPLLNAGLDPWGLVACGALGATIADGVGYVVGSSGRAALSPKLSEVADRLSRAVSARPRLAPLILFLWAGFAPLPNEVLVIPAGVLGYGVLRTGLITFCGNVVFNSLAVGLGLSIV